MDTEKNKELARQFIQDVDEAWGSGDLAFHDKWVTSDFKVHFNSGDECDYEAMRQDWLVAHSMFARARHDIHVIVAEGDLVSLVMTLHMMDHIGEVDGIAPTGRNVSVADYAVLRVQDGKMAEEWACIDYASLKQQLEAPSTE